MNLSNYSGYIEEYGKDVYSFCIYLTRNKDEADDLYQQTFLTAIEKNELDDSLNPKAYFISIAANTWKNHVRKMMWRRKKAEIVSIDEEVTELADEHGSAEENAVKNAEMAALRKYVLKLPEKLRTVILMFFMEDMSIKEISSALKIPEGTVKSRLNKAKTKLKEWMADYEG
ncbi:MAG: sigma-70 family RNA polymerase sigma factor [Lachnospiraceae bacterium]|nr:sigma-70 family RNA polymerase sigma factor [Lachnospiraceae bacterium]